ncbi:hypothetical protein A244_38730 [Pseudomonas syringae pv. actinidiae ICMP 18807]|uniref:Uncharacterized protein n=1 Tax=Pseudomonas syringae pv. actinidiae ICMP 18807 TaxID=1194404 RepID=S6TWH4_PSESF|nr:hypothetical protein [Pseudomonas syringae]EPN30360.1 hypothetical protein A244_38730 [Pseudomonas syringae pv. actinidiae ICMP 18807]
MNVDALKSAAEKLRKLIEFYRDIDAAASILLSELGGLPDLAERGQITKLVEPRDIPGYKLFTETRLQSYKDLEAAYTDFYIELIEGRETEAYKMLAAKMAKD